MKNKLLKYKLFLFFLSLFYNQIVWAQVIITCGSSTNSTEFTVNYTTKSNNSFGITCANTRGIGMYYEITGPNNYFRLDNGISVFFPITEKGTYKIGSGLALSNLVYCSVDLLNYTPVVGNSVTPMLTDQTFLRSIDQTRSIGTIQGTASVSLAGSANYTIPISLPSGTNGMNPTLSIVYDSHSKAGLLGQGWNITGLSQIMREGSSLYDGTRNPTEAKKDLDIFSIDGNRLEYTGQGATPDELIYKTRNENFAEISLFLQNGKASHFKVKHKNGLTFEYGTSPYSKVSPDNGQNYTIWKLTRTSDLHGNYILYSYMNIFGENLLQQISYTGHYTTNSSKDPYNFIYFQYMDKSDPSLKYYANGKIENSYVIKKIILETEGNIHSKYTFNYGFDKIHTYLNEIELEGANGEKLNTTRFQYGGVNSSNPVLTASAGPVLYSKYQIKPDLGGADLLTGDFNGDGTSDLIVIDFDMAKHQKSKWDEREHTGFRVFTGSGGTLTQTDEVSFNGKFLYPTYINSFFSKPEEVNFLMQDVNGDGLDDFVRVVKYTYQSNSPIFVGTIMKSTDVFLAIGGGKFDHSPTEYEPLVNRNIIAGVYNFNTSITNPQERHFISGDFDGDSKADYLTVLSDYNSFAAFLNFPDKKITNLEIDVKATKYFGDDIIDAEVVQPLDFNGDGKTDLMIINSKKTFIYSFTKISDNEFELEELAALDFPNKDTRFYSGEFNGDAKTDLLVSDKDKNIWRIFCSDTKVFNYQTSIDLPAPKTIKLDDLNFLKMGDFDANGYTDIAYITPIYTSSNTDPSSSNMDVWFNTGGKSFFKKPFPNASGLYNVRKASVVGDFNGDGKTDILCEDKAKGATTSRASTIFYFFSNQTNHLLGKVLDGFNRETSFTYFKATSGYYYAKGTPRTFPLLSVQLPMFLVSELIQPNGVGNSSITSYSYRDAVLHRNGLGFLGFMNVKSENLYYDKTLQQYKTLSTNESIFNIHNPANTDRYFTYLEKSISQVGAARSETTFDYTFENKGNNRWWQKLNKVTAQDFYTGTTAVKEYLEYDNDTGNVTTEEARINTDEQIVLTKTTYGDYSTPKKSIVTTTRKGEASYTTTTNRVFGAKAELLSETILEGTTHWVKTEFKNYNQFGLAKTKKMSGAGVDERTSEIIYSSNGRLAEKTINVLGQEDLIDFYDKIWGKATQTTSINGTVSTALYDGFGRLKESEIKINTSGNKIKTTVTYAWENSPYLYSIKSVTPGEPTVKQYFDIFERPIQKEVTGFKGAIIYSTVEYDSKGNAYKSTSPHYSGKPFVTSETEYDNQNRAVKVTTDAGVTSIGYSVVGVGKVAVKKTEPYGNWTTTTTDATGKVTEVEDMGGKLLMYYFSHGTQRQVKEEVSGKILTNVLTCDPAGRPTLVWEPNSGNSTYIYNAYGELLEENIANGGLNAYTYTKLGKIEKRKGLGLDATYTYYSSGGGINAVQSITGSNGHKVEFIYDADGRLLTRTETIKNKPFVKSFTYDDYNLKSMTYPSGLIIRREYDSNVYLKKVTDDAGTLDIFEGTEKDALGHFTSYKLGNNIISTNEYDKFGLPKTFSSSVFSQTYDFEIKNATLKSRKDNRRNLIEEFKYDEDGLKLERLTSVTGPTPMAMEYEKNGNINFKTGLGTKYTYHDTKIHAVTRVEDYPLDLNRGLQNVDYTAFHRASLIQEKFNYNGQKLKEKISIEYGIDYERTYSKIEAVAGHGQFELYYLGDFEQINDISINYVYGGDGLCAMVVNEGDGQGNKYHYVYKDYLGSILTLTDASGAIKYEQSFDAWGRRRSPTTWVASPSNAALNLPTWLYRGYTGHEHYDRLTNGIVQLINMNARLYDPVNARFLRWDIATSGGTQGMNRYSYARNNPLKYTDPSGNFIAPSVAFFLAVTISATTNVGINGYNNYQNHRPIFENAGIAAAQGAAAGAFAFAIGSIAAGYTGFVKFGIKAVGHGLTGGASTQVNGGSFAEGFATGAVSSMITGAVGAASNESRIAMVLAGGLSGGVTSEMTGGSFWKGFGQGLIVAVANDLMHMGAKEILDGVSQGEPGGPPTLDDLKRNPPNHPEYESPKGGDRKVKNPNGKGTGWLDRKGRVWVPTDHKGTHAPHWDREIPGGGYDNVYPTSIFEPVKLPPSITPPFNTNPIMTPQNITNGFIAVGLGYLTYKAVVGLATWECLGCGVLLTP
jgi:RHS repeat-associated protein